MQKRKSRVWMKKYQVCRMLIEKIFFNVNAIGYHNQESYGHQNKNISNSVKTGTRNVSNSTEITQYNFKKCQIFL